MICVHVCVCVLGVIVVVVTGAIIRGGGRIVIIVGKDGGGERRWGGAEYPDGNTGQVRWFQDLPESDIRTGDFSMGKYHRHFLDDEIFLALFQKMGSKKMQKSGRKSGKLDRNAQT